MKLICHVLCLLQLAVSFVPVAYGGIDTSRLLVATVVDASGPDIVRDSIALFRSIRKFGGSLNNATLLACFAVSRFEAFADDSLLRTFHDMGVTVDFIRRVQAPFPGTMNKFSALFKFDIEKFDYFLWLDADIVVFSDPIPQYPDVTVSGKIYCVPELYNYMIRFPALNTSELVWNPNLSPFILAGDEAVASHGVCNTGMLLFDRFSLYKFRSILFDGKITTPLQTYRWDRFLDSLFFVTTVNTYDIEVVPLSYSLNYMAFLEVDIMELFPGLQPVFAHFIANTTMTCYRLDPPPGCTCMYANDDIIPSESYIVAHIQSQLLPADSCAYFSAGVRTPPHTPVNPPISEIEMLANTHTCMEQSISRQTCEDIPRPDPVSLAIIRPADGSVVHFSGTRASVFVAVLCCVYDTHLGNDVCSCGRQNIVVIDTATQEVMGQQRGEETDELVCDQLEGDRNLVQCHKSVIVDIMVPIEHILSMPKYMTFAITSDSVGSSTAYLASVTLLAVSKNILPAASRKYSADNIFGQATVALDAQDHLGEFLNNRRLVDMGLALCCDSYRGLRAVEMLIERWGERLGGAKKDSLTGGGADGALLIVSVDSFPAGTYQGTYNFPVKFTSREELKDYLIMRCSASRDLSIRGDHLAGCVITDRNGFDLFSTKRGGEPELYRKDILSFVYIDSYRNYADYSATLLEWYPALQRGGVLIGSVYAPVSTHASKIFRFLRLEELLRVTGVTSAIDTFAYHNYCTVLASYMEHLSDLDSKSAPLMNALPAWYVIKEITTHTGRVPR